ncbi:MAG: hypothetical protein MJ175_09165, partial [Clostridia bacterium]|nr:hypothetical protein [Clostridia bacterium]
LAWSPLSLLPNRSPGVCREIFSSPAKEHPSIKKNPKEAQPGFFPPGGVRRRCSFCEHPVNADGKL